LENNNEVEYARACGFDNEKIRRVLLKRFKKSEQSFASFYHFLNTLLEENPIEIWTPQNLTL